MWKGNLKVFINTSSKDLYFSKKVKEELDLSLGFC